MPVLFRKNYSFVVELERDIAGARGMRRVPLAANFPALIRELGANHASALAPNNSDNVFSGVVKAISAIRGDRILRPGRI
jgi:hypothetical protein